MIKTRNEKESDYKVTEDVIRKAFYGLHASGYDGHYLVHIMCGHEDFIPELDLVLELNGRVIGNVMYTKTELAGESGTKKEILTFGPAPVASEYQRRGCGKMLMEHSFERAVSLGYGAIVIFGRPANYVSSGFKNCKKPNICLEDGSFPAAMTVWEPVPDVLDDRRRIYHDNLAVATSEEEARLYGNSLERMEKKHLPSQEGFYIMSYSFIR